MLARHGLSQLPIWNTEGGWGKDAQLPDENQQASFLVKWYLINFTNGVARAYWYQWDNPEWGTLWRESSGVTPAAKAYQQVYGWLDGVTAVGPCGSKPSSTFWTCDLLKGSTRFRVAWSASGTAPLTDNAKVVAITQVGGLAPQSNDQPVIVDSRPTLFRIKEP